MSAHRYWRVLTTAIEGGLARWNLNEIFFFEYEYGPNLTTFGALGVSSSAVGSAANLNNGSLTYSTITPTGAWVSADAPTHWIRIDFGETPREVRAVALWPCANELTGSSNGGPADAVQIQWSDDGLEWGTAWTASGLSPWAGPSDGGPRVLVAPGAPATPEYACPLAGNPNLKFWAEAESGAYTDAGVTEAVDGETIQQWANAGTGADFTQPTAARRPTFRTDGLNGLPYLECDRSVQQFFEDIDFTQPSGLSTLTPWTVCAVTDGIDPATDFCGMLGHASAANGGKVGVYFRSTANGQIHITKPGFRHGNVANPQVLVANAAGASDMRAFSNASWKRISEASNLTSTEIAATQFLRNTAISGGAYFHGKLYAFLLITAGVAERDLFNMQRWLYGKYIVGFAAGASVTPVSGEATASLTATAALKLGTSISGDAPAALTATASIQTGTHMAATARIEATPRGRLAGAAATPGAGNFFLLF